MGDQKRRRMNKYSRIRECKKEERSKIRELEKNDVKDKLKTRKKEIRAVRELNKHKFT